MPKRNIEVVSKPINLRLPVGIYNDIRTIITIEQKWPSVQKFIQDALNEKIDRWKKENSRKE
jgi:hypothetical protein